MRIWANLYGVATKRLNEQVKRNIERFPSDFMFQLTRDEFKDLKSQKCDHKLGAGPSNTTLCIFRTWSTDAI